MTLDPQQPTFKDIQKKKWNVKSGGFPIANDASSLQMNIGQRMNGEREEKMMYEILRSWFMVIIKFCSHILYRRTRHLNCLWPNVVNWVQLESAEIWSS